MSLFGFIKTAAKVALTGDSNYARRYELSNVFKGAVMELCKNYGFIAYHRKGVLPPSKLLNDTDVSTERYVNLIVDVERGQRIISYGFVPFYKDINDREPTGHPQYKSGINHQRLIETDKYENSFDAVKDIILQTEYMEQQQKINNDS